MFSFTGNIDYCLCYDGFLRYCSVVFCSFETNYTPAIYLRRLPYLQTIYDNRNLWLFPSVCCDEKCWPDWKLFNSTLFDYRESSQFKLIFPMNHGGNVWLWIRGVKFDFSYDLTEQCKSVCQVEIIVSSSCCVFGS